MIKIIMTLELTLPPELETKLRQHAERLGVDINTFVLHAIEEKLARVEAEQKRRAAKA